jgi:hypothetical protein
LRPAEPPEDEESNLSSFNDGFNDNIMLSEPARHQNFLCRLRAGGLENAFPNTTWTISSDLIYGFFHLALLYALVNNLVSERPFH